MRKGLILWFIIILSPLLFLACPSDPAGPTVYAKIVLDAYAPLSVMGDPTMDVKLMSDGSNEVPGDEDIDPLRVEMSDLPSGTYYIRVTSIAPGDQAYALRALSPVGADPSPIFPETINSSDTPFETDDGDINRNSISLGNSNYVNRYLDLDDTDTVDWLKLVLP